jgi:hypothetical protein
VIWEARRAMFFRENVTCAAMGGIGGLAPIFCQVATLSFPNFLKGTEGADQKYAFMESWSEAGLICAVVSVIFIIAFIVTYTAIDKSDFRSNRVYRSFLIGAFFPGMLVVGGDSYNLTRKYPLHVNYNIGYTGYFENNALLKLIYKCVSPCPSKLINVVGIKKGGSKGHFFVRSDDTVTIPLKDDSDTLEVFIPDRNGVGIQNLLIWNAVEKTVAVTANQPVNITLKMRPVLWNPVNRFFGSNDLYEIENMDLITGDRSG